MKAPMMATIKVKATNDEEDNTPAPEVVASALTGSASLSTNTAATGSFSAIAELGLIFCAVLWRFNLSGAATVYLTKAFSAATRSVFSQENSGNSLPK